MQQHPKLHEEGYTATPVDFRGIGKKVRARAAAAPLRAAVLTRVSLQVVLANTTVLEERCAALRCIATQQRVLKARSVALPLFQDAAALAERRRRTTSCRTWRRSRRL
jgi:hypothetical protein